MRNWRNDPVSEKQKRLIEIIEEEAGMNLAIIPVFEGTTKGEAFDFIKEYVGACHYSAYNEHEDAGDRI